MNQISRIGKGNKKAQSASRKPIKRRLIRSRTGTWSILGIIHGGEEGKQWLQAKENAQQALKSVDAGIDSIKSQARKALQENKQIDDSQLIVSGASEAMNQLVDGIKEQLKNNVYKFDKLSGWDTNVIVNYFSNKASNKVLIALNEINRRK